jgi:hypothetical protein
MALSMVDTPKPQNPLHMKKVWNLG